MRVLRKISFGVDKVCSALVVIMISIMLLATSAQIIWRVGSGFIPWMRPLSWSEELTRFLLVWSTFVGATCAYRHGSNIAITAAQALLPEGGKKAAGGAPGLAGDRAAPGRAAGWRKNGVSLV